MEMFTDLLRLGFSVIPVSRENKRPLIKWREFQERQVLERELFWWNRQFEDCNVGIVTGMVSNLVVLDIDSREGYDECKKRGLPATPSVTTGKGIHYYFRHPGDSPISNFAGKIPGVDLRADGGYVVGPGSYHADRGTHYEWRDHPIDVSYAPLPRWLLQLVTQKEEADPAAVDRVTKMLQSKISQTSDSSSYGRKALEEELAILSMAGQGNRNNTLFKVAVRLFELAKAGEIPMLQVEQSLSELSLRIGLTPSESRKTIQSANDSSQAKPKPVLL